MRRYLGVSVLTVGIFLLVTVSIAQTLPDDPFKDLGTPSPQTPTAPGPGGIPSSNPTFPSLDDPFGDLNTLTPTSASPGPSGASRPGANPFELVLPSPSPSPTPDQSKLNHFDRLVELFAEGKVPTATELVGMHAGRCYLFSNKDHAFGALLVADAHSPESDQGPLFSKKPTVRYVVSINAGAADQFDSLDFRQRMSVETRATALLNASKPGVVTEKSLDTNNDDTVFHLKKYKTFFVVTSVLTKDLPPFKMKTGDSFVNCYFYKKISE